MIGVSRFPWSCSWRFLSLLMVLRVLSILGSKFKTSSLGFVLVMHQTKHLRENKRIKTNQAKLNSKCKCLNQLNCLSPNITKVKFSGNGAKNLFTGFSTLQVYGSLTSNKVMSRVSSQRNFISKYQITQRFWLSRLSNKVREWNWSILNTKD